MPDFYTRTANFPATDATTNSPNMQAEFELIEAAMAKCRARASPWPLGS